MKTKIIFILCVIWIGIAVVATFLTHHTYFISQIPSAKCAEITQIHSSVQYYGSSAIFLEVEIERCTDNAQSTCCNKMIKNESIQPQIWIGKQELKLTDIEERRLIFEIPDEEVLEGDENGKINLSYKLDSLGVEISRHSSFTLFRNEDWDWGIKVH